MSAVYHINHQGGTRSARCLQVTNKMHSWSALKRLSLKAVYKAADLLSRTGPLPGEWRIHPEVLRLVLGQFGMAKIDLFATAVTAHCSLWFSLNSQGDPLGIYALSQKWLEELLFAFPPLPLIPLVLRRVALCRHKVLLVAPRWPKTHCFPTLIRLVLGHPWQLPRRADLLSQAEGQI